MNLSGLLPPEPEDAIHGERTRSSQYQAKTHHDNGKVILKAVISNVESMRPMNEGNRPTHDSDKPKGRQPGEKATHHGDAADELPPGHGDLNRGRRGVRRRHPGGAPLIFGT